MVVAATAVVVVVVVAAAVIAAVVEAAVVAATAAVAAAAAITAAAVADGTAEWEAQAAARLALMPHGRMVRDSVPVALRMLMACTGITTIISGITPIILRKTKIIKTTSSLRISGSARLPTQRISDGILPVRRP